jgi:hypothetical protein
MHSSNLVGRRRTNDASRIARIRKGLQQTTLQTNRWIAVFEEFGADVRAYVSQGVLSQTEGAAMLREIDHCLKVKRCECGVCSDPPFIALAWLVRGLMLRPECGYGWRALKYWMFRSADHLGVLPKQ